MRLGYDSADEVTPIPAVARGKAGRTRINGTEKAIGVERAVPVQYPAPGILLPRHEDRLGHRIVARGLRGEALFGLQLRLRRSRAAAVR